MVEIIDVEQAVGRVLFHDITRIVPGEFKGRAFKKGHHITPADVPKLKEVGKDRIYVLNLEEGYVHEDDAARRIANAICGPHLYFGEPNQGKIELIADCNGLLKVDAKLLQQLNSLPDITIATLHGSQQVEAGKTVAGTRIIPLFTEEKHLLQLEEHCRNRPPVVSVKPFKSLKVGLITTGNEIYYGRIPDSFGPRVKSKFEAWGSEVFCQHIVPDRVPDMVAAINRVLDDGAEMVVLTGGMSVDPDDLTPAGIRASGAKVISYGAPTYPGAMFMLAELDGVPMVGLPGCAMYHKATIVELIIPRLLAGETVTREEIVALGHGGICASCKECRYPDCGFGK
ncbi:molybdopterin-binding protein [Syntrophotalea acetylenivorans]|uniref:Molybdopterin molybdenumtransferase n=1 Tax=Syntrophotalea acetylenivorans TaxID=1842532 RepID=A0A1L3GQ03_9BACT|nr:molybdopterin-binding protein [Syntrophotalea acetylenivorans]APG28031.1 molybdopterin-binding protein [Syntrophotalea acetylenivorans]